MNHLFTVGRVAVTILLLLTPASTSLSLTAPEQTDGAITPALRISVIEKALKLLSDRYVFPDVAKRMEEAIRKRVERKEYDRVTSAVELADLLTAHLREVSHDKHIEISYSADPIPERKPDETPQDRQKNRERMQQRQASINYGFRKLERLDGNIGYMALDGFYPTEFAGETAIAAMNFLSSSDALIIDLRNNGGGRPDMVALLTSYLFAGDPVQLTGIYWRERDQTDQSWTFSHVPGKRYVDKDIYILTSKETISAAEAFTYNLKNLKRATVVGETTAGAANPGRVERINEHFMIFVPTGRAANPITKTNWEGTGVKPDIETASGQALKRAHIEAMKRLIEKTSDEQKKRELREIVEKRERQQG